MSDQSEDLHDEDDDSSDSADESFVSSQHAIKARSVRSAQKGGPVTSMSSRRGDASMPSANVEVNLKYESRVQYVS